MKRKSNDEAGPSSKRIASHDNAANSSSELPEMQQSDDFNVSNLSQQRDFSLDKEAEVGIIEKISLQNVMCHNRLDIVLGPNVNFIIGENGSGKSAVVTGLVVGLGGKASITNRGNKLKSFVKTGKQSACIEIKLRNCGPDAFKPELYGDSVIVQRSFNKDGTSFYKLKSKEGKVISQMKDDLTRMLDHFNIQVENPLAVLNQDTSRNFLNSKSSHDKYMFFLKATLLEQIKGDYHHANEQKDMTTEIINQKVSVLPKLEKEVLEWEHKYKSLTAVEDLKIKLKKLKRELAWAFVIEKEKNIVPLKEQCMQEEMRLPKFQKKAVEAKASLEVMNKRMTNLTAQLNACGEEGKLLSPAHRDSKLALEEQKKVVRTVMMEVKRLESDLKNKMNERASFKEKIEELQSSAKDDFGAERQARLKKIEVLEEKLASLVAQESTTDHQLDQFRSAITKYKNESYQLQQEVQSGQAQLEKQQRNLTSMKASQGNRLKRFGYYMPKLVATIDEYARTGKFHKKPIGPVGGCFTLKDQNWALAIEHCLKALLTSFICHDYHDEAILEQIMSAECPPHVKPSIIVSRFKDNTYNVSEKRADNTQFPSVLDMIQSDQPMVYNTLIDQRTVECILLIENGKLARQIMDPSKSPPVNAKEAFTLKGDQVFSMPTFRYYSSNQDKAKFLTSNIEEDILALSAKVTEQNQTLVQLRQQQTQINSAIKQNVTEERRTDTQLMKIRTAKTNITMEIGELKNIEEPSPVDVATYMDEVKKLDEQINAINVQLVDRKAKRVQHEVLQEELANKFRDIEAQMKLKLEAGESIKEEVDSVMNEIETCKAAKKHYGMKLKEQENNIKVLKDQLEKLKLDVQKDVEKASQIHAERINTNRTAANLDSEINQINKQISNEEKQRGNPAEITRQYKEKKDLYMKIQREVKQLKHFCERLDKAIDRRLDSYTSFRHFIATRAKYYFVILLSNRNYTGKMTFNHKNETLEMAVQPSKNSTTEMAIDLRALSGGERSFSTVCFILSLWETMESPFRFLDEFDVFMDMVNRRIAMEMMLNAAKSHQDKQFIFMSPQSMSSLGISYPKMKIFRMPNPERGQKTLEFPSAKKTDDKEDSSP